MRTVPHDYKVGDDVSYGFNGDWYHDGKVERITKSGKYLYTTTGTKFVKEVYKTRMKMEDTGEYEDVLKEGYCRIGGTWTLAKGVINERNPHF